MGKYTYSVKYCTFYNTENKVSKVFHAFSYQTFKLIIAGYWHMSKEKSPKISDSTISYSHKHGYSS